LLELWHTPQQRGLPDSRRTHSNSNNDDDDDDDDAPVHTAILPSKASMVRDYTAHTVTATM